MNKRKIIQPKRRIVMRFNNCSSWEHCSLSGALFEQGVGPAFFLNGNYAKSVSDEVALKLGFSVSPDDWQSLVDGYWQGVLPEKLVNGRKS